MKRPSARRQIFLRLALAAMPFAGAGAASAFTNELYLHDAFAGENDGALRFPIERRNPDGPLSIRVNTTGGTARPGDFEYAWVLANFADGQTMVEVPITLNDNTVVDGPPRTVELSIVRSEDGNGIAVMNRVGVGVIADDDGPTSTLALLGGETSEYYPSFTFHLVRQGPAASEVTGSAATRDGSAQAGRDYTSYSAPFTLAAGNRFLHLAINLTDDSRIELRRETFHMGVADAAGAEPSSLTATATIVDDESQPQFVFTLPASVAEGAGTVPLTIVKEGDTDVSATIHIHSANYGHLYATNQLDYDLDEEAAFVFSPDEVEKVIDIPILQDALDEVDEAISVYAYDLFLPDGPAGYPGSFASASATIVDDDATPTMTISDVYVEEGFNPNFPLHLTAPTGRELDVWYELIPGTATEPADYRFVDYPGKVYPGEPAGSIYGALVIEDGIAEPPETFTIRITSAEGIILGNTTATATIVDSDASPTLTIQHAISASEADGAATPTLTLTKESGWPIVVNYEVQDFEGGSGVASGPGQIVIPPGNRTWPLPVPFADDYYYERPASFRVTLTGADHAFVGTAKTSEITVVDDDPRPYLVADPVTVREGGDSATLRLRVIGKDVGDTYCLERYATEGSASYDDASFPTGTMCFTSVAGELDMSVNAVDDLLNEGEESLTLTIELYNYVDDQPRAYVDVPITILDNDAEPSVTLEGTAGTEGGWATFSATLDAPSGRTVAVDLALMPGTATAGSDFDSTTRTLAFAPGDTYTETSVPLVDNSAYEVTESFTGKLVNPRGAQIAGADWGLLIADDDPAPQVSASGAEALERDGQLQFTINKAGETEVGAIVSYRLVPITATGSDYTDTSGTITFLPSEAAKAVVVTVTDDAGFEADETFELRLENPVNATITGSPALGTILNDDEQDAWLIR